MRPPFGTLDAAVARLVVSPEEHARLLLLLARFDLERYRDLILQRAAPCIAVVLEDPPDERPEIWPEPPIGVSKVGGRPDLPRGLAWPTRNGHRAGFFLQLALAELPPTPWNPWPTHGMVYLFCHDDRAAYYDPPSWELVYCDDAGATLKRSVEPDEPLLVEYYFFESSDPRRLRFRAGTGFPQGSSTDWDDFVYPLRNLGRSRGDENVLDRYFEFIERAADPGVEDDLAKRRGPFFYPIAQLFGHTDLSIRADLMQVEHGDWRQVMKLYSNPATEYLSPADAAPVFVMAKDPGTRPWVPSGLVYGLAAA